MYYIIVLICRVQFVFQLPVSMLTSLPSLLVRVFIVTHRQPCPIVSTSCKRTVLTLMIVEKKRRVDSDCLNQSVMCFIGATMFYIWHRGNGHSYLNVMDKLKLDPGRKQWIDWNLKDETFCNTSKIILKLWNRRHM